MIADKRGFGIAQSIILCGFLVFLIIPLFTALSEKVYLKYSVHKINELADTAIMSSVFNLNSTALSEKKLLFSGVDELEEMVYGLIMSNPHQNMEITEFQMEIRSAREYCSQGCTSWFDFVHLMMKVSMERYGGRGSVDFYIHRDLEFPIDR